MAVQRRNDEMVDLLSADFQRRYEPNFAWKSACSQHLALPGLRGFWPMSAFSATGAAFDQSGNGRTLTYNGNPLFSYAGLFPFVGYDGVGDWHDRADEAGLDITGTESYVTAAAQGLTMGCWCQPALIGVAETLMSKWETVGDDRSYMLDITAGNLFQANISTDGTAGTVVSNAHAATPRVAATRYHVVMRFDTSAALDIIVNGNLDTAATAAAGIFSGGADFYIGAYDPGTNPFQGAVSLAFLCAAYLSDAIIFSIFQQSRAMFGI